MAPSGGWKRFVSKFCEDEELKAGLVTPIVNVVRAEVYPYFVFVLAVLLTTCATSIMCLLLLILGGVRHV